MRLLGLAGIGAMGTAGTTTALAFSLLKHVRDCVTKTTLKVNRVMYKEMTGREEKEDIARIKDTYP